MVVVEITRIGDLFKKIVCICGCIATFLETLLLAHALKGFETINAELLIAGIFVMLFGILLIALTVKEAKELIPISNASLERNKRIEFEIQKRRKSRAKIRDQKLRCEKRKRRPDNSIVNIENAVLNVHFGIQMKAHIC